MPIHSRISIQKLDVFCRVVQMGGVSLAAENLRVSQPVVTAHIRSLERQLDLELFDRSRHRRDGLTEMGRVVHAWAEDVVRRTRQVERDLVALAEKAVGSVGLGASVTVGTYALAPLVAEFRQSHPGVMLRLDVESTEHALEDIRNGRLDFAFVELADPELPTAGIEVERVGTSELVLVACPGAEPYDDSITLDELARLPVIGASASSAHGRFVDRELLRLGVRTCDVMLQFDHPEATKHAVAQGLGAAFIARAAVHRELERGVLREIEVQGLSLRIAVALVYHHEHSFSAPQKELLHELRQGLSQPGSPWQFTPGRSVPVDAPAVASA